MKWDIYVYNRSGVPLVIDCTQGSNAYEWEFRVRDYILPTGTAARIYFRKPSGTEIYNDCEVEGNNIKVDVTTQMTAEAGKIPAQFQIMPDPGNPDHVKPFVFWLNVQKSLSMNSQIESTDEFTVLDNLIAEARNTIDTVQAATENANLAAGTANDAAQAADAAAQGVNEAKDQAKAAAQAANTAAEAANSAAGAANSAAQGANTAKDRAETAAQAADEAAERANGAAAELEEFEGTVQEYINTGPIVVSEEDIPVAQRKAGHWYFFVTTSQSLPSGEPSNDIIAGPNNMALRIVEED